MLTPHEETVVQKELQQRQVIRPQMYEALGKKGEAARWRKELEAAKGDAKP
jgi:hypothetical protein